MPSQRGLGFIGSNLCRALADPGAEAPVVDTLLSDYRGNLHNLAGYEDRVRVNIADVRGHGAQRLVRREEILFSGPKAASQATALISAARCH